MSHKKEQHNSTPKRWWGVPRHRPYMAYGRKFLLLRPRKNTGHRAERSDESKSPKNAAAKKPAGRLRRFNVFPRTPILCAPRKTDTR